MRNCSSAFVVYGNYVSPKQETESHLPAERLVSGQKWDVRTIEKRTDCSATALFLD